MTGADRNRRDIHEAIAEWHENGPPGVELHDFLGLTWEEYGRWVEGGPLPKGGAWYDGARHAARQKETKQDKAMQKLARRRAQAELAALHRPEYMRLLAKHRKELEAGVERAAQGGDEPEECGVDGAPPMAGADADAGAVGVGEGASVGVQNVAG